MRTVVSIIGLVIFGLTAKYGIDLLEKELLSGTELSVLLIAFAVMALVLYFSTEIQEFSVGGNIVKLRQVKADAEQSIIDLKAAQLDNARFLISLSKRHPGGFRDGNNPDDSRVEDFWILYEQVKKIDGYETLAPDLIETLELIQKGQVACISGFSDDLLRKYSPIVQLPEPDQLMIEAFEPKSIQRAGDRNVCAGDIDAIKLKLKQGISTYRKLFELTEALRNKI